MYCSYEVQKKKGLEIVLKLFNFNKENEAFHRSKPSEARALAISHILEEGLKRPLDRQYYYVIILMLPLDGQYYSSIILLCNSIHIPLDSSGQNIPNSR